MDREIELLRLEIAELRREVRSLESKLQTSRQNSKIELQALKAQQSLNYRYNDHY